MVTPSAKRSIVMPTSLADGGNRRRPLDAVVESGKSAARVMFSWPKTVTLTLDVSMADEFNEHAGELR